MNLAASCMVGESIASKFVALIKIYQYHIKQSSKYNISILVKIIAFGPTNNSVIFLLKTQLSWNSVLVIIFRRMHSQRSSRQSQSPCNQISNIFSSHSINPALSQLIPPAILQQLTSRSHLTCSTVLNLREFWTSQQFDQEYRRMQLASRTQLNWSPIKEQIVQQQIPNFINENAASAYQMKQQREQNQSVKTTLDLLLDSEFLQKLNELLFGLPFEKAQRQSAALQLQD